MSNELNIGELQPQHSSATERIHHPGQRWNSGAAGARVQTDRQYRQYRQYSIQAYTTSRLVYKPALTFSTKAPVINPAVREPARTNSCDNERVLSCLAAATDDEQCDRTIYLQPLRKSILYTQPWRMKGISEGMEITRVQ